MNTELPSQDGYRSGEANDAYEADAMGPLGGAFGAGGSGGGYNDLGFLRDVELKVSVELGRSKMRIDELLKLGPGGLIRLDKLAGEPLDVRVNGRLIAHGEAVQLGEKFGIRLVDLVPHA